MSDPIPSHFSVHEINQHKLDVEYKHWSSRLNFFEVELDFYAELLNSDKFQFTEAMGSILEKIPEMKNGNREVLDMVHRYSNSLEGYRECEDLECDNFYLNDHEKFRVVLEKHSADIRDFKAMVFENVAKQI